MRNSIKDEEYFRKFIAEEEDIIETLLDKIKER
jgi:hypothetical protein